MFFRENHGFWSVPRKTAYVLTRLGLRHRYMIILAIETCFFQISIIRTWLRRTCTSGFEMIIWILWLSHILTNAFYAQTIETLSSCSHCPQSPVPNSAININRKGCSQWTPIWVESSPVPLVVPTPQSPKYKPEMFESTSKIVGLRDPKSRPMWSLDRDFHIYIALPYGTNLKHSGFSVPQKTGLKSILPRRMAGTQ